MRNPKWHRDEIILALDLYFSSERGNIDKKNPKIIALSQVLNELPLFSNRPDEEKFRNVNGVTLKLSNFLPFDPEYRGKGMTSGSRLDKEVFKEFQHDRKRLHFIASQIRKVAENREIKQKIYAVEDDDQTIKDSVLEGQVLYKLHKVRERDVRIVQEKKEQAFIRFGKLSCEACVFDFRDFYGDIGRGFIECHHRTPLSTFKVDTQTRLEDLSLVCSNCHRMIHRRIDTITVEELGMMIKYQRS